jgi:zinc protease
VSDAIADGLERERLDNGLTVLVRPLRTVPLVSVWCWYHVGSKDESPGTTGASHWVEHMNFKGTRGISREQMKVWIERAGGSWNGYTWIDQTTYLETLASDALDVALRIESERMSSCEYDPQEVESERTVILSELHGNENDPAYRLGVEVTASAFREHPYRWPTIGREADLRRMTRDELHGHYRDYYHPGNATLVIVGDVDVARALDNVRERFGAIESGTTPARAGVTEPRQEGERRVSVERPGTTAYLDIAYHAPAFGDDGFVPMLVADAALSGGKGVNLWSGGFGRNARTTSPLYRRMVDTGLVSVVGTALLPTEEPYLYGLSATVQDGIEPDEVEAALDDAIFELTDATLDAKAMDKARNQVLSSLAFESEGVTRIAHQLGFFETIGEIGRLTELPERIAAVTAEDVRRVASDHLDPRQRTVGWFLPTGAP